MQKSIFKSKIFWSALIPMLLDIVNLFLENPIVPEKYRGYLTMVSSVLIIVFRYTSNSEIKKI